MALSSFFLKGTAQELADAGDAARDSRDWKGAARRYRASLDKDDSRADLWVQLGHALKESGDLAGAEAAYRTALERDAQVGDTHLQLGHLLKLTKRPADAAEAYARAAELEPRNADPVNELRDLARKGVRLPPKVVEALMLRLRGARRARALRPADQAALKAWLRDAASRMEDDPEAARAFADSLAALDRMDPVEPVQASLQVVFDVSDLMSYFGKARLPTGIQRVQIEVISALLRTPLPDVEVRVCAFTDGRDDWVEVPAELMLDLSELSLASGSLGEPAWVQVVQDMQTELELGAPIRFARGAWLINLGTSWWLRNYFLHVRRAQANHGVRYVPFVHDMIPVMAPEHCVKPLTQDFISWALGVFAHADHFLTNSQASRRDLVSVAARLGHEVRDDQTAVIRLDADFRKPVETPVEATLERFGLSRDGYILFVSTIESRKNHLMAFKALSELIGRHGPDRIPKLVCVGNRGWLNDAVFARLAADPALKKHVLMLSGVADGDLSNLYDACLFTLYPSSYEGWGLPVTESLCHAKPVLASDSSSLPEAGGDFASFFPDGDQAALTAGLERLILDQAYREQLRDDIRNRFRPRPWRTLSEEIMTRIAGWRDQQPDGGPREAPAAQPGRFYRLGRNVETTLNRGSVGGEIFRVGTGWSAPDDWGCWTTGRAELRVGVKGAEGPLRLFLGLLGIPGKASTAEVRIGGEPVVESKLGPGESRWLTLSLTPDQSIDGVLGIEVVSPDSRSLAEVTGGVDTRRVSVGVIGFMACAADDLTARADFMEALTTNGLEHLQAIQAERAAGSDA